MLGLLVAGILISIRLFAQDLTTNGMHTIIRDGYTVNWSNSHLELRTNDNSTPWMTFHRAGYSWRALGFDGSDFIDNYSNKFLLSSNFNSFAPTLTGIGASGNWNINAVTATNATQWNGYPGALSTFSSGADLTGLIGIHPNGTAYRFDAPNVKYFLGIPSGGETLQSVTDRANTTTNFLTIGSASLGHINIRPGGSTSAGYVEFYKSNGTKRLGYIGYNNENVEYSAEEGSHIFTNGNVGIGTTSPTNKLEVNGDGFVSGYLTSSRSANEGGGLWINNPSKTGTNANRWAIYNMTGAYGNGLNFWKYGDNGNTGPQLQLMDNGVNNFNGNLTINGHQVWHAGIFNPANYFPFTGGNIVGDVAIGTTAAQKDLAVNGNIKTRKVKVTQTDWADYVFDSSYQLTPLHAVEKFIQQNKHLPEVPSAAAIKKDGIDLGDNQAVLLKKIEELTLYIIEQDKRIKKLEEERR
jgi:hypothetical protein